ncbi:hypothetical protein GBA52_026374 [Prunus armeniaca]|nr:hypothetical protein GBA52_026374 [Prunus armeniaca]
MAPVWPGLINRKTWLMQRELRSASIRCGEDVMDWLCRPIVLLLSSHHFPSNVIPSCAQIRYV